MHSRSEHDYAKVGGWLKFFGMLAGGAFLLHLILFLVRTDRYMEIMRRANADDAGVFDVAQAIILLMPFVALAQCICIFERKRLGRTLSLVFFGYITLFNLFTLERRLEPFDADPENLWLLRLAGIGGVIIHAVPFAYFVVSDRVKKTLVI